MTIRRRSLARLILGELLLITLILIGGPQQQQHAALADTDCDVRHFHKPEGNCGSIREDDKLLNVPILRAVHCRNDGSGVCKALAGRYEFYYNSFEDKFMYSAPPSDFVDDYGYHKRLPVTYTVNGDLLYADISINWANDFVNKTQRKLNLLSIRDFNWCAYTEGNYWPYKSAIKKDKYHIYFYNRQSCVFDTKTKKAQHFNTRFLHNSSIRIDLDMNPTIFAMEDKLANGDLRLVKHKRQHWYEVEFSIEENPTPELRYFVKMGYAQTLPSRYNDTSGPMLSKDAYSEVSKVCLSDQFAKRSDGRNNQLLDPSQCGLEETETADWINVGRTKLLFAGLHNIPEMGAESDSYFNVTISGNPNWNIFAADGLVFSAFTSIPAGENKLRVIMLYATYEERKDDYDEFYPLPKLADYIAQYNPRSNRWSYPNRNANAKTLKYLNYVDDIAYLEKCDTILTIFGPLYTEHPKDSFNIETKAPIGSIFSLGMWEPVNAFFGEPGTNTIWAFHRTNYVAGYTYTCGLNGQVVTATRASSYYHFRGPNRPPSFKFPVHQDSGMKQDREPSKFSFSEEWTFQQIGVFKGSLSEPEPPNPLDYKSKYDPVPQPIEPNDGTWLYWVIGFAILLIIVMAILCCISVRRWHRRRKRREATLRSSNLSSQPDSRTIRTSMSSPARSSGVSAMTVRSGLTNKFSAHPSTQFGTRATSRSSLSSNRSSGQSNATRRSSALIGSSSRRPSSIAASSARSGKRQSVRTMRTA